MGFYATPSAEPVVNGTRLDHDTSNLKAILDNCIIFRGWRETWLNTFPKLGTLRNEVGGHNAPLKLTTKKAVDGLAQTFKMFHQIRTKFKSLKRVQECYRELRKINYRYLFVLETTNELDILSTERIGRSITASIGHFLRKANIPYEHYSPKLMSDHCGQIWFDAVFWPPNFCTKFGHQK